MRVLELMNGRAIGLAFAAAVVVIGIGFLIVGTSPSDGQLQLVFWSASLVGGAVSMYVVHRDFHAGDDECGPSDPS